MLTIDIILKTYPTDYDWITYCFRSIAKHVTGYRNIIVLLEEQYPEPPELPSNAVVARSRRYVDTETPTNVGAVIERLRAWHYSDAERLLFVDSDCVFIRPIDFQTDPAINIEKPVVLYRTWEEAGRGIIWRAPAAKALGYDPPLETMVGYPFCFSREVMMGFWDFVGGEKRLLEIGGGTDWNALGNYALDKHADKVTKVCWTDAAARCIRQFWSWHRAAHPDVQAELKALGLAE